VGSTILFREIHLDIEEESQTGFSMIVTEDASAFHHNRHHRSLIELNHRRLFEGFMLAFPKRNPDRTGRRQWKIQQQRDSKISFAK